MIFGEKGIDDNQRRNATVICSDNCEFGIMSKEDYIIVLRELSIAEAEKNKNFIRDVIFKKEIEFSVADRVYYDFFRLGYKVKKGDIIFG